jgi:hypothetical protein
MLVMNDSRKGNAWDHVVVRSVTVAEKRAQDLDEGLSFPCDGNDFVLRADSVDTERRGLCRDVVTAALQPRARDAIRRIGNLTRRLPGSWGLRAGLD